MSGVNHFGFFWEPKCLSDTEVVVVVFIQPGGRETK